MYQKIIFGNTVTLLIEPYKQPPKNIMTQNIRIDYNNNNNLLIYKAPNHNVL